MKGIFISAKDIQVITGCSSNTAYRTLALLKISMSKEKHQHVTIAEYCRYEGVNEEEIKKTLKR